MERFPCSAFENSDLFRKILMNSNLLQTISFQFREWQFLDIWLSLRWILKIGLVWPHWKRQEVRSLKALQVPPWALRSLIFSFRQTFSTRLNFLIWTSGLHEVIHATFPLPSFYSGDCFWKISLYRHTCKILLLWFQTTQ